ncbi:MAG: hypothetical protein ACI4M3_09035, partial [Acutalibacteraceae bacterium]
AVAERICELKLGYKLDKSNITPKLLREKVEQLLSDTEVEQNVKKMAEVMQFAGGVKMAADRIEEYCNN